MLGQKDYEQYEIGLRVNDEATDLYYAVNDQITDIPVFWYKDKLVEKPRMTFRDGYVHLIDPYQVRHNTNYSTFTVDEFKLKKNGLVILFDVSVTQSLSNSTGVNTSLTTPVFRLFQK